MAQSPDNPSGDGEKDDAATPHDGNAVDRNLPMVLAPRLGAGEDDAFDEVREPAAETVAASPPPASSRFLLLAATVAFAASFGSFVGSVSGSGFVHYLSPAAPPPATESASASDTSHALKQQLADLSAIKANLDAASRNATSQFAKLSDRLDRIDQHTAAAETTGSIAAVPPAAAAAPAPEPAKSADRILPDWIVQDVQNGRALVESRNGGMFDVGAGSFLPGVGRVDGIKRQDGQWLVLTARGTITSGR
jgi:FlaG/FlaF family flagellin (archaellin)